MCKLKLIIYCFISVHYFYLSAVEKEIIAGNTVHYSLSDKDSPIDFIVCDTFQTIKKPVLLFCQGSLPIPLFIKMEDGKLFRYAGGVSNFEKHEALGKYHVIVLSKPHTPLIAEQSQLDQEYSFVEDPLIPHSYLTAYLKADKIENYVWRANKVLDFLRIQNWVSADSLIILGHSEGAINAAHIATTRSDITRIGLLAFNPMGRADELIRKVRKDAEHGMLSWTNADQQINDLYAFISVFQDEDSLQLHPELIAWNSFSKPQWEILKKIKSPLFIGYGTQDITAEANDLLPLFLEADKSPPYCIRRYIGLDHNFFPVREGNVSPKMNAEWLTVISDFLDWNRR